MDPSLMSLILQVLLLAMDKGPEEELGDPGMDPNMMQHLAVSRPSVRPQVLFQQQSGGMSRMMV